MFTCDLGGSLNRIVHMYNYEDFDARDTARHGAAATPAWAEFVAASRAHLEGQASTTCTMLQHHAAALCTTLLEVLTTGCTERWL